MLSGVGIHSGEKCEIILHPAEPGSGILFLNSANKQEIPVIIHNIHSTTRCTAIQGPGGQLSTVEHVLSAVNGLGLTDVAIEFDGPEVPIMDGSSKPFADAIEDAGIIDFAGSFIEPIVLEKPITVIGNGGSVITAVPSESLWISVIIDYPDKPRMLPMSACYYGRDYRSEVAPARTYGFVSELEALAAHGLAKGASKDNAFALQDNGLPADETPLRFLNEAARHKLLDLLGDLTLAGRPLRAGILAARPSHTLNSRLVSALCGIAD
jgi:UDP-3-O-[3-hydroxymyristoyl] N-acetylglucosamine deacetylase